MGLGLQPANKKKIAWQKVWRYIFLSILLIAIMIQFVVIPIVLILGAGVNVPSYDTSITISIISMLGVAFGIRTFEKVKNVDSKDFYDD